MRRLTIRAQYDVHSGYGQIVSQMFSWLTKRGVFAALRPEGINELHGTQIPKEMRAQIVHVRQPEPWELIIYCPTIRKTPDRKTVHFGMWESTILAPLNVSLLSQCEAVIVPSEWCAKSFKESGLDRPILVCPLGFDPDAYKPTPISESGPTVFGIAGRVAHCPKRKMVAEAMRLFLDTFKGVEDVRLHVKIHPDDKLDDPKDRRVKIFRDVWEPYQLGHWLQGLTTYVTLARSEGYGLWPLQALACGRPVVGCAYSGHADFMNETNSFLVPFREITVDGVGDSNVVYEGNWANPDQKVAAQIMQAIHKKRSLAIEKGAAAPATVADLTWEKSTDKLIVLLEKIGVWA